MHLMEVAFVEACVHNSACHQSRRGDASGCLWAGTVARTKSAVATSTCEFFGEEVGAVELGLRLRVADFGQLPH